MSRLSRVFGWTRPAPAPAGAVVSDRPPLERALRDLARLTRNLSHHLERDLRLASDGAPSLDALVRIEAELRGQPASDAGRALGAGCANLRCLGLTLAEFGQTTRFGGPRETVLRTGLTLIVGAAAGFAEAFSREDGARFRRLAADDGLALELRRVAEATASGESQATLLFDRALWLTVRLVAELDLAAELVKTAPVPG